MVYSQLNYIRLKYNTSNKLIINIIYSAIIYICTSATLIKSYGHNELRANNSIKLC